MQIAGFDGVSIAALVDRARGVTILVSELASNVATLTSMLPIVAAVATATDTPLAPLAIPCHACGELCLHAAGRDRAQCDRLFVRLGDAQAHVVGRLWPQHRRRRLDHRISDALKLALPPRRSMLSPIGGTMPRRTQEEAEAAVRVLIEWAGDDPDREGLLETPKRVAKSYKELFAGYAEDPRAYLEKTFEEVGGYDELIVLQDIRVVSFCEHHMLPFLGRAHVGYLPKNRVVGISKLARVVNSFARRMQIQEKLTAEIAEAIQEVLDPHGVGVMIESEHSCMTMRGVNTPGSNLVTSRLMGVIRDDPRTREEFLKLARQGHG